MGAGPVFPLQSFLISIYLFNLCYSFTFSVLVKLNSFIYDFKKQCKVNYLTGAFFPLQNVLIFLLSLSLTFALCYSPTVSEN